MKVSISLITYQHADTAQQALESVLLQDTDFEFETILGDDASTDGSQKILLDCLPMARGPVKTLFRETNAQDRGLTNVVQTIDAAEGEYIAFIDGDDFWTDMKKLQKQVDFLDAHPECAMCAHRVLHQRDDGGTALSTAPPNGDGIYNVGALIRRNFAPKISSVVRRSALADLPAWYRTTTVAGADWLLNVLASRHGDIGFLDQIMATHRVHGGGVSVLHGPTRMASDKLSAIPLLRDYLPRNEADFAYLERQLVWKMRTARLSPRAFTVLKRLNELARPRPV